MKRNPFVLLTVLLLGGVGMFFVLKSPKPEERRVEKPRSQGGPSVVTGLPDAAPGGVAVTAPPAGGASDGFWRFSAQPGGNPEGLDKKQAAESRGNGVLPSGRRFRIESFPNLRSLSEGSQVSLSLPDGRSFSGIVNYSRLDKGYENTHQVAIGFTGDKGGLVAIDDAVTRRVQGRLLIEGDRLGWTVETDAQGDLWLVEHLREDMVCELPAIPMLVKAPTARDPAAEAARSSPLPGDSTVTGTASVPPTLNSRPTATAVLYLDFDGEPTQTYPDWPVSNPATPIAAPASGLTADQMTKVWRRVAEDYAQFNINISTELAKYNAVSAGQRMRIIVANTLPVKLTKAGVAGIQSFRTNAVSGYSTASNIPAWMPVTPNYGTTASTMTDSQLSSLASNITHEFGHTLALWHDGNDGVQPTDLNPGNYYPGHGTSPFDWSPIMGAPYAGGSSARAIIQWAKNDYPGANNAQDDLAVIAGSLNGFGYAADESSSFISSGVLTSTGTNQVGGEGIVSNKDDLDWWQFQVKNSGSTTVEVVPADESTSLPNLDCGFRIEDATGTVVAGPFATVDSMEASATMNLAPGVYYVVAYGTGNRQFSDSTGYNNYGSTGRYLVTVGLPADTEDPVPVILSPVAGTLGSPTLQFNGTANDNDHVSGLSIFLRRNSDSAFWNGSYWQVGTAGLNRSFDSGNWNCTSPLPQVGGAGPGSLNAGSYDFIAIAEDPAGHSKQASVTVMVDSAGPVVTIGSPTVILGASGYSFNGTSQDAGGVQAVNCFIRRESDGQYWNGSGWGAPAINLPTDHVSHTTAATRTWQCVSPGLPQPGAQLTQGAYTFIAIASDQLGNPTQTDSLVLIDDNAPPQVAVTTPVNNGFASVLSSISGTATDLSGIKEGSVSLTLFQSSTGFFWNGVDWVSDITALQASLSGSIWTYPSVPSGAKLTPGQYFISVHARDNGGTLSDAVPGVNQTSFQVDLSPPTVSIESPLQNATVSALPSVSGLAADGNGISTVRLYLYRYNDGKYWDGSSWGGGGSAILPTQVSGGTWSSVAGSLPAPGSNQSTSLTGGTYDIIAFAVDTAGNQTRADAVVTVEIIYTWTGATLRDSDPANNSTYWGTPENWSPVGVPGAGDTAVIDNGDTVDSSINRVVAGFKLISGNLNFTNGPGPLGTLSTSGKSTWASGLFNGIWTNGPDATLELTGTSAKQAGGNVVINNSGLMRWTGTGVLLGAGGGCTLNNLPGGTYEIAADGPPFENYNGNNVFNNAGTFVRTGGAGTSVVEAWGFNNSGTIRCDAGVLQFDSALNLNAGTAFGGTAQTRLNGPTTVNADFAIPAGVNVTLTGGGLNCAAPGGASLVGGMNWQAGTLGGTLNIAAGSTLNLVGAVGKDMAGSTVINNAGTVNWSGGSSGPLIGTGGGCTINNLASGVYNVTVDGAPLVNYNGNNVFNNAGTLVKTGGTGTSSLHDWTFNNSGAIRNDAGTLAYESTLNINAGAVFSGAAPHQFNGTVNVTAGFTINPATSVTFKGGSLNFPGAGAAFNGVLNWLAGSLGGTLNIPSGSTLNLLAGSAKDMAGATVINNAGTVNWNGGSTGPLVGTGGGCTINNLASGVYNVNVDGAPLTNYNGNNVFNNAGILAKTGGTDISSLHDWTFNNSGTVRNDAGMLAFESTLNINAGSLFSGAAPIQFNGTQNTSAPFGIAAGTQVKMIGGSLNCADGMAVVGRLACTGGMINGTLTVPAGSVLDLIGGDGHSVSMGGYAVINNSGTINWDNDCLLGSGGACTVNNLAGGVYNLLRDGNPFQNYNGGNVFNNAGRLAKTGGAGTAHLTSWVFNNTGEIRCDSAVISLESPFNLNSGSALTGSGAVNFNSDVRMNAPVMISTSASLSSGSLTSTGGRLDGTLNWSSGSVYGTLVIAANSTLNFSGMGDKNLGNNAVLDNAGTINWSGLAIQNVNGFGGVNNQSAGVFNVTGDGTVFANYGGTGTFTNAGVFRKNGGSSSAYVNSWVFNNTSQVISNSGSINFNGGELDLNAGGQLTGSSDIHLSGGTTILRGDTSSVGGHVIVDGANVRGHADGTGRILGGGWDWYNGTWSGAITVGPTGVVSLVNDAERNLDFGAQIDNYGTITATGTGSVRALGSSRVANHTGATLAVGTLAFTNYNGGNQLTNDGVVTVGSSVASWSMAWDFVQSSAGRLNLDVGGLAAGTQFDQVAFTGSVTLGGTLNVTLINGFVPAHGSTFSVLTYPSHTGTFATFTAPGALFTRSYNAGDLTLTAANSPANLAEWKSIYFESGSPDADDGADPDRDGVPNLLEYATGGDPHSSSPLHTPVGKPDASFVEFDYPVNIVALNELTFAVEWRDSLSGGTWSTTGVSAPSVISSTDTMELMKVMVPTGGRTSRYMHLSVTKN
ncbi:hypothetical protein [Prosthecobacter sp.]|uniref:hypothetical protein n=1 Tax=Prosthecobacter sp. TaxID=1965333 RepID=UPI003783738C